MGIIHQKQLSRMAQAQPVVRSFAANEKLQKQWTDGRIRSVSFEEDVREKGKKKENRERKEKKRKRKEKGKKTGKKKRKLERKEERKRKK